MQIDFYEEFPTQKNLEKLKLIEYPMRLFIAAHSLEKFKRLERKIKKIKKDAEVGYWPIVKNSYWISPFANHSDLRELFQDLEKTNNPLLIDLELPLKNKILLMKNLFRFSGNKKLIKGFMKKNKARITTAELPSPILFLLMKILGLDYNIKTEKSLMWYSSVLPKILNSIMRKSLKRLKNKNQYSVSLGTIATGILGNEPILTQENLEKDLEFVKNAGFNKVIIFRLGGLNQKYINIINSFQNK